ncbi:hypothetical protein ACFV0B_22260 [Streptomyces xanthophaeus]|uniref:hypothetical protein n=1 Tax=Streptomyces xanthophaeus TaxID=67385 RepID=UPI0036C7EB65
METTSTPDLAPGGDGSRGEHRPRPARRRASRSQLDFPPVRNGIDYLLSVIEHLHEDAGGGARELKYAVLHLQAAAEVLLKARLRSEHWTLVFKDPGEASLKKYEDHDFESCGTEAAVARLRRIGNIPISDKDAKALKDLAKDRNALQHYGLTHSAEAVEARAATVLDFLMNFVDKELLPSLSADERAEVHHDLSEVREALTSIHAYVTRRMNRLRGSVLKDKPQAVLTCEDCQQDALLLGPVEGDESGAPNPLAGQCHFCGGVWNATDLASIFQPEAGVPFNECPQCHAETLASVTFVGDSEYVEHCFDCNATYSPHDLANCAACGCFCPHEGDDDGTSQTLCDYCRQQILIEEEMA